MPARIRHGLTMMGIYVAMSGAVITTIPLNNAMARRRAEHIIAALDR